MKPEVKGLNCGREDDLISFLYGELDPAEKLSFSRHLHECAGCRSQLGSFNNIRESVGAWRNESLGVLTSPAGQPALATPGEPGRSALAALREFFNLSPLWLKGAVAFASCLFCLFAVLAAARFRQASPAKSVVHNEASNTISAQEFNAEVERRVQQELQRREASRMDSLLASSASSTVQDSAGQHVNRSSQVASVGSQRKAGRPLSRLERQELAADLRLIADDRDIELVLIGDRMNH